MYPHARIFEGTQLPLATATMLNAPPPPNLLAILWADLELEGLAVFVCYSRDTKHLLLNGIEQSHTRGEQLNKGLIWPCLIWRTILAKRTMSPQNIPQSSRSCGSSSSKRVRIWGTH